MTEAGVTGYVGLGSMGSRMATRLVAAGLPVVTWTRSGRSIDGAQPVRRLHELTARCPVIVGCLLDDSAVESVYLGAGGILESAAPGTLLVEHGTYSPALARRIGDEARVRHVTFVDAPVTGGPEGADAGTLVSMAGGDQNALDAHAALFAHYLARIERVGPIGSGLALKLVNQLLVSVHIVAVAEAASLLIATGIDTDRAISILGGGWAASAMLERELPRALRGEFESAGATIGNFIAVQELVADAIDEAGIRSRLLPEARALFSEAVAAGWRQADPAALVTMYTPAR